MATTPWKPEQCAMFSDLFAQLGLPNTPPEIAAFINQNRPLANDVLLHAAPFWTPAQSQFIREERTRDEPPWTELIDQLNAALRDAEGQA